MTTNATSTFTRARAQLVVNVQLNEAHSPEGFQKALLNDLNWGVSHYSPVVEIISATDTTVELAVSANLDPIPGWGHTPEDWQRYVQRLVDNPYGDSELAGTTSTATVTIK